MKIKTKDEVYETARRVILEFYGGRVIDEYFIHTKSEEYINGYYDGYNDRSQKPNIWDQEPYLALDEQMNYMTIYKYGYLDGWITGSYGGTE